MGGAGISIHSARVGGDIEELTIQMAELVFQSTPPVWAETHNGNQYDNRLFISIHSARVGGDADIGHLHAVCKISIHSARVGGDDSTI